MPSSRSKKPSAKPTNASTPAPRRSRGTKLTGAAATPTGAAAKPAAKTRAHPTAPDAAPASAASRDDAALDFLPARSSTAPRSGPRHAVFIDVENTSSEVDLVRVLEGLKIDRVTTDLSAVGNWRVVGQQLGRMLAQRGAHLVHSAPAPRVPDWSDLWIAVTAGMWLGRAAPGDALDILSDDRAFDAVGDAAARLGVKFRRITYRSGAGVVERTPAAAPATDDGRATGRRRRRRRRGEGGATHAPRAHATAAHVHVPPAAASSARADEERHSASLDQIRAAIARLTAGDPGRGVSLDTLTLELKAEGFQRPPGSPRLVTRLRRIKDVELLSNGRVRLVGATAEVVSAAVEGTYDEAEAGAPDVSSAAAAEGTDAAESPAPKAPGGGKRRSRRRGGRGRRGGRRHAAGAASPEGSA
ncbi:MAG: hypothetical protein HY271_02435 [Deltaproteobacteria bacterium]|nr:hypothetical protein [Deltaproteobacteria bacterium]